MARGVFFGVVHGPLEHAAVNGASTAFISARDDSYAVTALEAVLVARTVTLENGHTTRQQEVVTGSAFHI